MRFLVLASSRFALPTIDALFRERSLETLICPKRISEDVALLRSWSATNHCDFHEVTHAGLEELLGTLLVRNDYDAAFVFGFPWRIPGSLLDIPRYGFINVHFSLLPVYQGPDPVFWQIRNGETEGGITLQRMTALVDQGQTLVQQRLPFSPGETWGICQTRYGMAARDLVCKLAKELPGTGATDPVQPAGITGSYFKRLSAEDLFLDWETQSATEIENLVNASNPNAGGAITFLRQQPVKILEVSPVDGKNEQATPAGTIIHTDVHGMFVQCLGNEILRITVVSVPEGVLSGAKFAALGVRPGERFHQQPLLTTR